MEKYNKCVMAMAETLDGGYRLAAIADKYRTTTNVKAWLGPDNTAVFFPVDKYDEKHITEMLREKGFSYITEPLNN